MFNVVKGLTKVLLYENNNAILQVKTTSVNNNTVITFDELLNEYTKWTKYRVSGIQVVHVGYLCFMCVPGNVINLLRQV